MHVAAQIRKSRRFCDNCASNTDRIVERSFYDGSADVRKFVLDCAPLRDVTLKVRQRADRTSDDQEVDPWGPWFTARPEVLAACEPSHSIVGTAADMARFYQALHHSGRWPAATIAEATRVWHEGKSRDTYSGDEVFRLGLFVCIAGNEGGAYLPVTASPSTYGMGGAPCQASFMDPEHGVSFCFLTNGYPMSGYDHSRAGENRWRLIANLAGDLLP